MRRTVVVDDKLDDLILERDSIRIQLSLLADKATTAPEELMALRSKAHELDELITARQRTV